jgi:N6-L-threonylcarbamoyladenine synthase
MLAARERPLDDRRRADIARGVQDAIVATLLGKTLRAMKATGINDVVVAGGVGANRELRTALEVAAQAQGGRIYFPRLEFCTDNAAMIAMAGMLRLKRGGAAAHLAIEARAQWPLASLNSLTYPAGI